MTGELTRLERRIEAFGAGKSPESDRDFRRALASVIDAEASKDAAKIDAALLAEALDTLLAFSGEDAGSVGERAREDKDAFLSALRREDPDESEARTPRRGVKWRLLIPIAAALVALASLAAATLAGGWRVADLTNDQWKSVEHGEKIAENGVEIDKAIGARGYDELEKLIADEGADGVIAPKGVEIAEPLAVRYGDRLEITAELTLAAGETAHLEIDTPTPYNIEAPTTPIAGFDVLVSHYDDVWQGEWIADGVWYMVKTANESALEAFIAAFAEQ